MIAQTITGDLGLSVTGAILETADAATFEQIHLREQPNEASVRADVVGMAIANRVLVRADKVSMMRVAQRTFLYAHELAHIAQGRLLNGSSWPTWLTEGHASWVAYQVSERLGYAAYATCRAREQRRMRAARRAKVRIPALSDLETSNRWDVCAAGQNGSVVTYGQAFLAVDRLVERYSAAKLVEFLQRSGDSTRQRDVEAYDDSAGQRTWHAAFPIAYRDFVDEFHAHLQAAR